MPSLFPRALLYISTAITVVSAPRGFFGKVETGLDSILTPGVVRAAEPSVTPHLYLPMSIQQFIDRFMPNYSGVLGTAATSGNKTITQQLNEAKEDQDLTLSNVRVNKLLMIDPLIRTPMYYGLLTNNEGKTQEIIDNFDCEYNVLSNSNQLNIIDNTSLPVKTKTYKTDAVFRNMTVKKVTDVNTSVSMFSSRSFTYNGQSYTCEKISSGQRFSSWVKTTSRQIGTYIIGIVDRIKS